MTRARMGRPKSYVSADLLSAAIRTFRQHGYAGASLDVLTRATGLRRGSLYAAYPDKRALFLAALGEYTRATVGHIERTLSAAADPLDGITETLRRVARVAADGEGRHGCLLTNTATELAGRDPEIQAEVAAAFGRLEAAYAAALERARAAGRLAPDVDPGALARLCVALMHGLRVLGKSGVSEGELQEVVDAALGGLGGKAP
jgi:TetR/AcrR family transcriptional repressor of nem operon